MVDIRAKEKLTLSVDGVLIEMAKQRLDTSISQFLENQLRRYFSAGDDVQRILDENQELNNKLNANNERLSHIRKKEAMDAEFNKPLEKAMTILNRMHERLGVIGENQISYIAGSNNLEFHMLKEECEKEGMNIVPFSEVPKY